MKVCHVATLDLAELEPYRTLRAHTQHWKDGHFVAEGERVVRCVIDRGLDVLSFLMSDDRFEALAPELAAPRFAATRVFVAPAAVVRKIVGFALHRNLMAIARIPPCVSCEALAHDTKPGAIAVALEALADAENMGMILRNMAGFGIRHLIVGPDSASPYLRRSVRVSIGSVLSVGVHRCDDVLSRLEELRASQGWRIVGTAPAGGVTDLNAFTESGAPPLCLLLGGEAYGLTPRARATCDALFSIPMHGVESLNVANASAVAMYEATRKR